MNLENGHQLRVLVADDSTVMRTALLRMLESSPTIRVCGTARDGAEAVEKTKLLQPDVVTLDVDMPVMDGLQALKQIMRENPCPVIMVSSLTVDGAETTLAALDAGAFDYLPKEDLHLQSGVLHLRYGLLEKIEAAARSPLSKHRTPPAPTEFLPAGYFFGNEQTQAVPNIVVVGTSTGGPKALQELLPQFPRDLPVGILIVQHMPPGFTGPFAKRLNGICKVQVREAHQGEAIESGTAYIAPAGRHTTIFTARGSRFFICLSDYPADTLHKPSVDVTMLSVADVCGNRSLGVILTGMGSDGLDGMRAIRDAGGITIGQDEASCVVYGMPRACAEKGVLQRIVPLSQVPAQILRSLRYRAPS